MSNLNTKIAAVLTVLAVTFAMMENNVRITGENCDQLEIHLPTSGE